ncbi:MAG: calcium-binding protein, partial [Comamonas sp.]|uniref:calcium-binding protein n=1 Tax=Comamonas sp. TaxID=34028 RepID=UPI002FC8DF02
PVPVDGVPVTTAPGDGGTTIITIPVILPTRPDSPNSPNAGLADIPLVKGRDGHSILEVSLPVGVALQAQGLPNPVSGNAAQTELGLRIERSAGGDPELTNNGQVFLATLDPSTPLTIQTIIATVGAGFNPGVPFVISGSTRPGDGMQAVILDARALPSGSTIEVDNVDFLAVVGAVRITGGAGQNMASGDGAAQYIVLGADDDIIHGGGGNDTVGSKGGDDKIYGDAGDDIVFGGAGNDLLSGGSGSDRLNGGTGYDVALQEGKRSDYTITLEGAGIKLTHGASGVSDWLVDVEQVRFATGPSLTVAYSEAEEAAAFLFQQWMGREPTPSEGAVIQTLQGKTALQVAELFALVFPQQAGGRTAQQLLEGMDSAGAIRVDAERATAFTGDAGDNTFTPTPGLAWSVDGGAGIDTVVFPASFAQMHIEARDAGFTLQRMTDGAMLELSNVERLTLEDTHLALDLDGHAGQAAKLIGAVAGAAFLDNKPLVGEVIRALDAGVSAQSLAQLGLQLLGAKSPLEVTQLIWTNVVGSAATPAQLQPFVAMLSQGVTGGELAVLASNLDLNATRIDLVGLAATGIEFA